jgi:hypothetical protein
MPRHTLAAITLARGVVRVAEEVDVGVDDAELDQRPGDDRELAVVDPPEGDGRQHRRHDPRQQHDGAQEGLERQMLVEQQRQPHAEPELQDAGHDGVDEGVVDRQPEHRIAEQPAVVLQPDEHAAPPDGGVGHAQPDAEAQRIGEEHQQDGGRRQHEQHAEELVAGKQPFQQARLVVLRRRVAQCFGCHAQSPPYSPKSKAAPG